MNKHVVLRKVALEMRTTLETEGTGHDWWHVDRVRKNALLIAKGEKVDLFVVELGALLHDIADHKFHGGDETIGPRKARVLLDACGADEKTIEAVCHIVENVSYSRGVGRENPMKSLEGMVVQDADRLDALGAIGIARAFAYGGFKERPLYDPKGKTRIDMSHAAYKKGVAASTIHHFYEKLFFLKDGMHTKTGKRLAHKRDAYVRAFLEQFLAEWDGKR